MINFSNLDINPKSMLRRLHTATVQHTNYHATALMWGEALTSLLGDPPAKSFLETEAAETRAICSGRNKGMVSGSKAPGGMT